MSIFYSSVSMNHDLVDIIKELEVLSLVLSLYILQSFLINRLFRLGILLGLKWTNEK